MEDINKGKLVLKPPTGTAEEIRKIMYRSGKNKTKRIKPACMNIVEKMLEYEDSEQ